MLLSYSYGSLLSNGRSNKNMSIYIFAVIACDSVISLGFHFITANWSLRYNYLSHALLLYALSLSLSRRSSMLWKITISYIWLFCVLICVFMFDAVFCFRCVYIIEITNELRDVLRMILEKHNNVILFINFIFDFVICYSNIMLSIILYAYAIFCHPSWHTIIVVVFHIKANNLYMKFNDRNNDDGHRNNICKIANDDINMR